MIPQIYDSPLCKEMRRKIQAQRIKRLKWDEHTFKFIMNGLGYGTSLRDLDEIRLGELYTIVKNYKRKKRPAEFIYDQQGKYMYALQRQVGWDDRAMQAYMAIQFRKTHWNLLSSAERARVIQQLKDILKDREVK